MKAVLVPPLNYSFLTDSMAACPSYGVLYLRELARRAGFDTDIVDLNRLTATFDHRFVPLAVDALAETGAEVVGFSCLCDSYHLVLDIARRLKARKPDCRTVLGGPQASVTAEDTLTHFDCVDLVVRGEAEISFPLLLAVLRDGGDLREVPGVTFRTGETIAGTEMAAPISDLDTLPVPDLSSYSDLLASQELLLDAGRGCPHRCAFCTTSLFWSRQVRYKSVGRLVGEIEEAQQRYNIIRARLIHDNFTIDKAYVSRFCRMIIERGIDIEWSCHSRPDRLDHELLGLMRDAGCFSVVLGVETGSSRLQQAILKSASLDRSLAAIRSCIDIGIWPQIAIIYGLPGENEADREDTLALIRQVAGMGPSIVKANRLMVLAGSEVFAAHRHRLTFSEADLASELSYFFDGAYAETIGGLPELFSCYHSLEEKRDLTVYYSLYFQFCRCLPETVALIVDRCHDGSAARFFETFYRWSRHGTARPGRLGFVACYLEPDRYLGLLQCYAEDLDTDAPTRQTLLETCRRELARQGIGPLERPGRS